MALLSALVLGTIVVPPICQIGWPNKCVRGDDRIACPPSAINRNNVTAHVTETGFWEIPREYVYYMDWHLVRKLSQLFTDMNADVVEFGAGTGCYTNALLQKGIRARGYDGSPRISEQTGGLVHPADLSSNLVGITSAWVLCLEVAEHIPKSFEKMFLHNLDNTARDGIILSWSSSATGNGHVNPRHSAWVETRLDQLGFEKDKNGTAGLRESVRTIFWLRDSIAMFRRKRQN